MLKKFFKIILLANGRDKTYTMNLIMCSIFDLQKRSAIYLFMFSEIDLTWYKQNMGQAVATLRQKLASSLEKLHKLQSGDGGSHVFRSKEFLRIDRERLLAQGFLREVIKGWVISTSPDAAPGDTTPWFASFWEFCARYCDFRFGTSWHLSPELSLLLHAEDTVIPSQVIIYSPRGTNNTLSLLFGTSLYDLKSRMPKASDLMVKNGLRLFNPATALVRVSEDFMRRHPAEVHVLLAGIRDSSEILAPLLEGGHTVGDRLDARHRGATGSKRAQRDEERRSHQQPGTGVAVRQRAAVMSVIHL